MGDLDFSKLGGGMGGDAGLGGGDDDDESDDEMPDLTSDGTAEAGDGKEPATTA